MPMSFDPGNDATGVQPGESVTVTAERGTLADVSLVGKDGKEVVGELGPHGTTWVSTQELGFGKTYTFTATAVGADGHRSTERSTFTTADPASTVEVNVNFWDGQTVGVGMPLIFRFTQPVPNRAAVEEALRISTEPDTAGAFRWFSDDRLVWRPQQHWQPGTAITVQAEIYGRALGDGAFGAQDKSFELTVGDSVVAVADGQTHTMTVTINGQAVRNFPISMGDAANPTPQGTYTVMADHTDYVMDSSTFGVPSDSDQGYRVTVDYATRLSWSGIFFHSAPWSLGAQGAQNVSHGCLNMSTAAARWLMNHSKPGDLVQVRNSGGAPLAPTDGWSVWQMPWKQWEESTT